MRNKLSLSLLTCLAISGGGYLHAEFFDVACKDTNDCVINDKNVEVGSEKNIGSISGNKSTLSVSGSLTANSISLKEGTLSNKNTGKIISSVIKGDNTTVSLVSNTNSLFQVDKLYLSNSSKLNISAGSSGYNTVVNVDYFKLDNSSIDKSGMLGVNILEMVNNASYKNTFYSGNIGELKIDETSTFHNWQGGSTIKKVTNNSKNGSNVTLKSEGSGIAIGDSSSDFQGNMSKVNIEGTTVIFSNLALDNTNKINVSGNIVLDNKINIDGMDLSKTTSTPTSHKIVIKDGSNVIITDTNLTNQSINANSKNDTSGSLTIIGGIFKDVSVGGAGTNLANVTLDKVNIENSGLNKDNNIIAQNITLNNITTSNNANINAKTKLDIKNSKIDNTNKLTATNAEIGTSTIGADINVANELKAINGANLDGIITSGTIIAENGSIFNGNTTATDSITANSGSKFVGSVNATDKITSNGATFDGVVEAKDLESSNNSKFNNNITISNSITSNDTTFAKNVSANTITANSGSVFNGTTTATDKITSSGATFNGEVTTTDLESSNNSKFNNNITISNSITSNDTTFAKNVSANTITANSGSVFNGTTTATDKITSNGATFDGLVNTTDLESSNNSKFNNNITISNSITSSDTTFAKNVSANTITSTNSVFNGTTTATDSVIANSGSKFVGNVNATNKITSSGATFNGVVKANELEANLNSNFDINSKVEVNTLNTTNSIFSGSVNASNSINSTGSTFKALVNTSSLTTDTNSVFSATSKVNVEKLTANNTNFQGLVDINCKNTDCTSSLNNSKFNELSITNATISDTFTAHKLTANDKATFEKDIKSDFITANSGSVFNGTTTATDSIIANGGSTFNGFVSANNITSEKSVFNEEVKVKDTLKSNNSTFNSIVNANTIEAVLDTKFSKDSKVNANTINASKSIFDGEVVVSNLNALNTKFNGATTIDCKDNANCKSDIKASYFNDLTLKNNAKITLDEGSSANNLTLSDDTTYLALNGKSKITGDIKNEGIIEIVDGTISSKITGSGDLISNKVVYTNDVELSDIKGSGGKFGGITTTTNDVSVDNTIFEKDLNVGKTLYANQGNKFSGKVSATDAIFSLDTSKSMEKGNVITANQVDITKDLNIKDLNVTAENIKSNSARITNSTINSSNINSNLVNIANSTINSKLLGKDDSSSNVYDANIQKDSGTYTTKQSELNGGVRVDKLDTTNTHIKGQVAVNTLVANSSKFYIYGGGIDTSFHDIYSGAIIVREAISGANNTIQLANTNLTMLKDKEGFIPIAIVNNTTNSQRSDLNSQSGISKDFFKVTYQTKVANYELADRFTHFNPNAKGNAIWSIGIKGDDLIDESNVVSVISGQDLGNIANGANSNNVNTSSLEVVLGDMFDLIDFDKDAVGTANFILTSPDYIANTKNNTLNNRLRLVKNQKVGNGFWLDNQMGYNKYEYSSIRYKNFNVGADKTNELSNSNLTLGVAASFGTAETKGNVNANSDSKGIGLYAMNVFNNGVFIGANAFYHNISSSYEADKLGIKADKNHNVYTASFESGVRFGDKYYFEPSLRYDLTSYKPTAISTNGLSISGDNQLKHILSAKLEGGVSMLDSLDGFLSVALSKELTKKPDMLLIDEVKENIIEGKKGDTSVNLNFGVDYKINPNASFNINLGSNLYTNSDKELKGSLGFNYKF